jgi:5'-3' exonuclease
LRGFGKHSASALLGRYGHLEAIPEFHWKWEVPVRGAVALAECLRAHREEALLYRTLATLRTDVPLREGLDALRWRGAAPAALAGLEASLGEAGLAARAEEAGVRAGGALHR